MTIREAEPSDLTGLLSLYTHLKNDEMPKMSQALKDLWREILSDPKLHIFVAFKATVLVSSCILVVIPNLTHRQRPYGLIENVVTHPDHRGNGYATKLLNHARNKAIEDGCYKIMLMTGSKQESTLRFYEKAGYNRDDKTAFIQWID